MVLAEHLSAETKAKLKQSRTMKNYAQGSKYHIEFIKFICQIHLMIFLSLMFCKCNNVLAIISMYFPNRQHFLCPISAEVRSPEGHVSCQVISKLKGFFKIFFTAGQKMMVYNICLDGQTSPKTAGSTGQLSLAF